MNLSMSPLDLGAFVLFAVVWLAYEPLLKAVSWRTGSISGEMRLIRRSWMRAMTLRDNGLTDANLLGHTLNSASFFASSNLILIAAVGGSVFSGARAVTRVLEHGAGLAVASTRLVELKLALVLVCLVRGLLALIWSIRQLNYCLALIGAAHEGLAPERRIAFADAVGQVLNPALTAFSHGVRAYYFALAGAAWLFGPAPFIVVTLGAFALLVWRQAGSPAAAGVRAARALLDP